MKKISRIVGLAAMLIAIALTGCAPVTDSSEWKLPIASTTVKPEELNKTPLTAQGLERVLQGWWNNGSESYYFTVDNGVKKGYKKGGALAPSASVRATIGDTALFDHEEYLWEGGTGGNVKLIVNNPTGATDSIANKVEGGYNYDYFFKDKAVHANGTVLHLNLDFATKELAETYNGVKKGYVFDFARSDEMNVLVGYDSPTTAGTVLDKNSNNARNFDKYVAKFVYTTVTRSGTSPTYTYAMGTAEHTLEIIDLVEDIAKLNKLIARGYGIEEFEIPVAFDPDTKIKLMTVSVYNSKEGKVKEYKNIAYTKVTDTTASKIAFTVNDIDYELTMPAATTPATYGAADYDVNAVDPGIAGDDGKGKIALKTITADDKTGAMFIFKMEDKYVGRITIAEALSRAAAANGTANTLARANTAGGANTATSVTISHIRNTFYKTVNGQNQLIIGDRGTTSYDPMYSVYKPYHDFYWIIDGNDDGTATTRRGDGDTTTVNIIGANGPTTTGRTDRTMVLNGKFTPHKATFYFFQASDDIIKDAYHMGNAEGTAPVTAADTRGKKGWLTDGDKNVDYDNNVQAATVIADAGEAATNADAFDETALNYGLTLNTSTTSVPAGFTGYEPAKAVLAPDASDPTAPPTTASNIYALPANGSYQSFEVEVKDLANGMKMEDIIAKYGRGLKTPADITINDIVYKFKGWSDWFNSTNNYINDDNGDSTHYISNMDKFQGWQNVGAAAVGGAGGYDINLPANSDPVMGTAAPYYANTRKPLSTEKYTAFQSDGTAGNDPKAPFQIGVGSTPGTKDNLVVRLFAQYERKGVYAYFYKANKALEATTANAANSYDTVSPAAKVFVDGGMVSARTATALERNKLVADLYNGTPVADVTANGRTEHHRTGPWYAHRVPPLCRRDSAPAGKWRVEVLRRLHDGRQARAEGFCHHRRHE